MRTILPSSVNLRRTLTSRGIVALARKTTHQSMNYLVDPPPVPSIPVRETEVSADEVALFPVRRIYCVGRNYADHVKEMGGDVKKDAPVFFCKPADGVLHCPAPAGGSGESSVASIPFPLATESLHHE